MTPASDTAPSDLAVGGDDAVAADDTVWTRARASVSGTDPDLLNIAEAAVLRRGAGPDAGDVALRWLPIAGEPVDVTYGELATATRRFADVLHHLPGVGDRPKVATLAGRIPELWISALGTLAAGGIYSPLFSAFGPEPIRQRVDLGAIEVLVTTSALYERKVAPILDELDSLQHVILVDESELATSWPTAGGVHGWEGLMAVADPERAVAPTRPDDPALLHFTSGTTGTPKGALHVHEAVVAHHATAGAVLDLRPGDVFWCTADPGWVTGTSYGIIAPLTHGAILVIDEGEFDAQRWYQTIETHAVEVWYTAPTAIRMMMRAGADVAASHDLSSLRLVGSVGEPLNPEAVTWAAEVFGAPVLDNWWQTETGGIMIANRLGVEVRPGSMGRPVPGIAAGILRRDDAGDLVLDEHGHPIEITEPDETGELCLRVGWPSMFRAYLGMDERYASCFVDGWYRSGDLARRDADGWYWFVGRGDDVIKSAGHLVGPFEVESTLIEHPAVSEAAVIGLPHEAMGEIVKAYVLPAPGHTPDDEGATTALLRDVRGFARSRLGPAVAPRLLEVVDILPKTRSGKIMRRLLKARELGLPEGDTSTLEEASR